MNRVAVLVSGRGSNLEALLAAAGDHGYEIVGVASNRPDARALAIAEEAGLTALALDHRAHTSREAFDAELDAALTGVRPDWLVLAGFMRVLTPGFVARWLGRMINIHPSLLPAYPGLHTHQRALEAGDEEHGASVHFVTGELDGGPVIARVRIPVRPQDTPDTLAQRLLPLEHQLLPLCTGWLVSGKARFDAGMAMLDGRPLDTPAEPLAAPR